MGRVMVIEDSDELRAIYREVLESSGWETVSLADAPDDLDPIRQTHPDVLVLDLHFGGRQFEGLRLLQLLRSDPRFGALPVVVATAAPEFHPDGSWLRQHHVTLLTKPFDIADLEAVVASAVAGSADGVAARH